MKNCEHPSRLLNVIFNFWKVLCSESGTVADFNKLRFLNKCALGCFLGCCHSVPGGCGCSSISHEEWHFISCFASFQDPKIFYYLNLGILRHSVTFTTVRLCWKLCISQKNRAGTYPTVGEKRFTITGILTEEFTTVLRMSFYPAMNYTSLFCSLNTSDFAASCTTYPLQLMSSFTFILNFVRVKRMQAVGTTKVFCLPHAIWNPNTGSFLLLNVCLLSPDNEHHFQLCTHPSKKYGLFQWWRHKFVLWVCYTKHHKLVDSDFYLVVILINSS